MLARCRWFFLFFLPLLLTATGCRNRTDGLETELRTRETLYREALEDQRRAEARMESLQREVESLRKGSKIPPEQAAQTFGLKRITLGRSTGGYDQDNVPGDELLQVVVEPRDESDHTIKAPGTLLVQALETNPQGIKIPLYSWEIPAEKLRQSWKQGLLSTGYTLSLPWKNPPQYEMVRVVVRFITPDQRVFEADKDVKVRLIPGAAQMRSEPNPDALPPRPLPNTEMGPAITPTGKLIPSSWTSQSPAQTPSQPTQWRSLSLKQAITIGRPEPLDAPHTVPPPPSLEELLRQ